MNISQFPSNKLKLLPSSSAASSSSSSLSSPFPSSLPLPLPSPPRSYPVSMEHRHLISSVLRTAEEVTPDPALFFHDFWGSSFDLFISATCCLGDDCGWERGRWVGRIGGGLRRLRDLLGQDCSAWDGPCKRMRTRVLVCLQLCSVHRCCRIHLLQLTSRFFFYLMKCSTFLLDTNWEY